MVVSPPLCLPRFLDAPSRSPARRGRRDPRRRSQEAGPPRSPAPGLAWPAVGWGAAARELRTLPPRAGGGGTAPFSVSTPPGTKPEPEWVARCPAVTLGPPEPVFVALGRAHRRAGAVIRPCAPQTFGAFFVFSFFFGVEPMVSPSPAPTVSGSGPSSPPTALPASAPPGLGSQVCVRLQGRAPGSPEPVNGSHMMSAVEK